MRARARLCDIGSILNSKSIYCSQPLLAGHRVCAALVEPTFAFVHVNVIPMDRERVLRDQTVLIKNGKTQAIGSALLAPLGARVIDHLGTAYLSPGLADMHTHSETRNDLAVYLASGVRAVLQMGGRFP
jgi:hypothetical protein